MPFPGSIHQNKVHSCFQRSFLLQKRRIHPGIPAKRLDIISGVICADLADKPDRGAERGKHRGLIQSVSSGMHGCMIGRH